MQWLTTVVLLLFGYLMGSIPFSYWVARTQGVDLRKVGSGNTGATNVWRTCGFRFFVIALALDMFKSYVPTAVAYNVLNADPWTTVGVGLAAMLGHVYPVFMGFRGGKAVATIGGVMTAMHPILLPACALVWGILYKLTGYASVASLAGIVIIACATTAMAVNGWFEPVFAGFIWVGVVVLFYLHRSNIDRLMRGAEHRIERRAK